MVRGRSRETILSLTCVIYIFQEITVNHTEKSHIGLRVALDQPGSGLSLTEHDFTCEINLQPSSRDLYCCR